MRTFLSLVPFLLVVAAAAATGSLYLPGPWYEVLNKPWWTPPNWLFPLAWTVLYVMIAIAGWLAWRAGGMSLALAVWAAGLIVNAMWSYVMFGRQEIGWALVTVAVLWAAIVLFMVLVWPLEKRAVWWFAPYLGWVSFAAVLNAAVYVMNR